MQLPCSEIRHFEMTHFYIFFFFGFSLLVSTDRDEITCQANELPHCPVIVHITPRPVKICLLFSEDNLFPLYGIRLHSYFLVFVVPSIMLYSSEISPTRCNNCVLFFAMALLYMFWATISLIIRSTYDVYGHR